MKEPLRRVFGNCPLILGDSFEVLPTLDPVDAVITDPPYNYQFIDYSWDAGQVEAGKGKGMIKHVPYNNKLGCARNPACYKARRKQDLDFYGWSKLLVKLGAERLREGGFFVQFCDHKSLGLVQMAHKNRLYLKDTLVWVRSTGPSRGRSAPRDGVELSADHRSAIMGMWEGIVVSQTRIDGNTPQAWRRTGLGYVNVAPNGEHQPNVFYDAKKAGDRFDHPAVKPLSLMRKLVQMFCPENRVVLDPFLGSGTTAVACVMENRRFVGVERDPTYYALACRRVEEAQRQRGQRLW